MHADSAALLDVMVASLQANRGNEDGLGWLGYGVAELFGPDGELKQAVVFKNLITTAGDQYYTQKGIVGIAPANATAPTPANGMKLGTSSAAVTKSGAGAALGTYASGSNLAFDATFPQAAAKGGDTGWNATYKSTWGTGVATANGLNEVVIVNDAASNATTSAANTICRALLSPVVNKGASDTLAVTWVHTALGA